MTKKRTLKRKKQRGGFSQEEIDRFFEALKTPYPRGMSYYSMPEHEEYGPGDLPGEFFERDGRHDAKIKKEWHDVVRNGHNSDGYTALYMVCRSGTDHMFHIILKVDGMNVNAQNKKDGSTPAMGACWQGGPTVIKLSGVVGTLDQLQSYAKRNGHELDLNMKNRQNPPENVWKLLELKSLNGRLKI